MNCWYVGKALQKANWTKCLLVYDMCPFSPWMLLTLVLDLYAFECGVALHVGRFWLERKAGQELPQDV